MECGARLRTSGYHQIATIRLPQEDRREYPGLRQGHRRAAGCRSLQRLHFRGRQDLASHKSRGRGEPLRSQYAAGLECRATGHHRYRPGDYETWSYIAPIQKAAWQHKSFEYGTWGGEFRAEFVPAPGEIVAQEHWCSSGFANTDLDLQLKKHGIHQLIVIGLIAHTCIEATVRFAAELGYQVTVVKDATADYSDEIMHAALDINIPNYASAVVTAKEVVDSISSL